MTVLARFALEGRDELVSLQCDLCAAEVGIRAQTYWDVAVVHQDDVAWLATVEALVPATQSL
jgi:hypothetical protein